MTAAEMLDALLPIYEDLAWADRVGVPTALPPSVAWADRVRLVVGTGPPMPAPSFRDAIAEMERGIRAQTASLMVYGAAVTMARLLCAGLESRRRAQWAALVDAYREASRVRSVSAPDA